MSLPPRQALAVAGRSSRGRVTGKLRAAIEAMVWEGSCRPDAAKAAGLKDHSLREALRKPHVRAFSWDGPLVCRPSAEWLARDRRRPTECSAATCAPPRSTALCSAAHSRRAAPIVALACREGDIR